MQKNAGIKPSLLTTAEPPPSLNEAILKTIVGSETNLTILAELNSVLSVVPGVPDSVFDQLSALQHSMEKMLLFNHSALSATSPNDGSTATLTKLIQDECDEFRLTCPAVSINIVPLSKDIDGQATDVDADLLRRCVRGCLDRTTTTGVGTARAEITIECEVVTKEELYDLPGTLQGSYIDSITPRIHVNAAAQPMANYLIVQCTVPTEDPQEPAEGKSPSPKLSAQDAEEKINFLAPLVRSARGFCGEMSGFAAPAPSTCCIWFALPLCASEDSHHSPVISTHVVAGIESGLDPEPAAEHENSIQRLRSLSSEEDPNAHRINTRAALDADSPAHRALRSSLAAVLPASSYSATDSKYLPAPFFDPVEAARFQKYDPFPVFTKRMSRRSLMVAVNAAFSTPQGDSPSVTPVSRWKQAPEKVTGEGNFDSSGSTDPGMTGMAGLSVKGKESPSLNSRNASANPIALPSSLPVESPVTPTPPSPVCVQPHNR